MKTKLVLVAFGAAILLAWSACGKKDEKDSSEQTTSTIDSPVGALAITCGGKSCVGTEGT